MFIIDMKLFVKLSNRCHRWRIEAQFHCQCSNWWMSIFIWTYFLHSHCDYKASDQSASGEKGLLSGSQRPCCDGTNVEGGKSCWTFLILYTNRTNTNKNIAASGDLQVLTCFTPNRPLWPSSPVPQRSNSPNCFFSCMMMAFIAPPIGWAQHSLVGRFPVPLWTYPPGFVMIGQRMWELGQSFLSLAHCKNTLVHGGHVFWPISLIYGWNLSFHPPKPGSKFGVDRVKLSKVLFTLLFYRM